MIPNALLGRVNSIYRLLAWGMMPVGLVLSGLVVSVSELAVTRATALVLPFWVAGMGSLVVTGLVWGRIRQGFAGNSP
jgi:sulfite exporter TauE/SafE